MLFHCLLYLYVGDGLVQPHVDVPGEHVLRQSPHNVQLLVGLVTQELGVHLLPAVTLPLLLLLVYHPGEYIPRLTVY